MTPEDVWNAVDAGAVVIDMRPPKPFATRHITGAINFQFNRADLADRAEMALPRDVPFVVHAEPEAIAKVAATLLADAGFQVRGYLEGGLKAWEAAGLPTVALPVLTATEVHDRSSEFRIIDVREGYEYKYAHVPGADLLEWTKAWGAAAGVVADKPIALVCGDQARSTYVASVLQRAGKPAHVMFGGMSDWQSLGYPTEKRV